MGFRAPHPAVILLPCSQPQHFSLHGLSLLLACLSCNPAVRRSQHTQGYGSSDLAGSLLYVRQPGHLNSISDLQVLFCFVRFFSPVPLNLTLSPNHQYCLILNQRACWQAAMGRHGSKEGYEPKGKCLGDQ